MSDPTKTAPADASTTILGRLETHITDTAQAVADGISGVVSKIHLSKPAAEIATALEATLEQAGLVALKAGEASVLDALTPAHVAAIEQIFKAVDAVLVKEVLARIALPAAVAAASTAV